MPIHIHVHIYVFIYICIYIHSYVYIYIYHCKTHAQSKRKRIATHCNTMQHARSKCRGIANIPPFMCTCVLRVGATGESECRWEGEIDRERVREKI